MTAPEHITVSRDLLEEVRELYERPGPVASVYLPSEGVGPEAIARLEARWRSVRRELAAAGYGDHVLDRVQGDLGTLDMGAGTMVALIWPDGHVVGELPDALPDELVEVGPVPVLFPVLAHLDRTSPHLVVLLDRVGAEVFVADRGELVAATTVQGDAETARRSSGGGWSQRRFQQRTHDAWEQNAAGVAEQVVQWADEVNAELIAVAGDPKGVPLLRAHLPPRLQALMEEVDGSRAEWSYDKVGEEAHRLQATAAARRRVESLHRFAEALAHGNAVEGVDEVIGALRSHRVESIVVAGDVTEVDERRVHLGVSPTELSRNPDDLVEAGPGDAPLLEAVLRAAAAQGARLVIAPRHGQRVPEDGIGAVLRGTRPMDTD